MTERIIDFLDTLVATVGAVDKRYCLVEKRADVNGTNIPYKYTGNGNYQAVNVDGGSISYFRLVNSISFDVVDGNKAVKNLQGTYPIRYVAMVRRDDTNPLTFSQDVANVLEGRNKDLQTQLQAKSVNITVNSINTDTVKIWGDEFAMPLTEPNYTRSMVMINLTVTVIAARSCWENCDDFPDILQGFDWCSETAATVGRLTPAQIACLEAYLCGNCPDNETTVNSTPYATAPSGTPINVDVEDTTGADVGSLVGGKWQIANATVENSNSTVSVSVEAEGSDVFPDTPIKANGDLVINQPSGVEKDVVVRYETQGVVPTTIVSGEVVVPDAPTFDNPEVWFNGLKVAEPGSGDTWFQIVKVNGELPDSVEWDSPNANFNLIKAGGGATLTIEVYLDAGLTIPYVDGVDFQDDIWIHINTDLTSPTEYRFLIFDNGLDGTRVVQAGDTLQWNVRTFTDIIIYAEAVNGSSAACALSAFEVEINADGDANAYIAAHNALSGMIMGTAQQLVVQGTYARLKGGGTTFGSNLWTIFKNSGTRIFGYTPVDDSTVSIAAYGLDMIQLASQTFHGFVPQDFAVTGLKGGGGKYTKTGMYTTDFGLNNIGGNVYRRTTDNGLEMSFGAMTSADWGSATDGYSLWPRFFGNIYTNANSGWAGSFASNGIGHTAMQRTSSSNIAIYRNGTIGAAFTKPSVAQSALEIFGHATNSTVGALYNDPAEIAWLCPAMPSLTDNEMTDYYEAVKYYQENIITGGRHVV